MPGPRAEITLDDPAADYVSRAGAEAGSRARPVRHPRRRPYGRSISAPRPAASPEALLRPRRRPCGVHRRRPRPDASAASPPIRASPAIEGLNARDLTPRGYRWAAPSICFVADVSFITLRLALPPALELAEPGTTGVFLVKPQFEAGREAIAKNPPARSRQRGGGRRGRVRDWLAAPARLAGEGARPLADPPAATAITTSARSGREKIMSLGTDQIDRLGGRRATGSPTRPRGRPWCRSPCRARGAGGSDRSGAPLPAGHGPHPFDRSARRRPARISAPAAAVTCSTPSDGALHLPSSATWLSMPWRVPGLETEDCAAGGLPAGARVAGWRCRRSAPANPCISASMRPIRTRIVADRGLPDCPARHPGGPCPRCSGSRLCWGRSQDTAETHGDRHRVTGLDVAATSAPASWPKASGARPSPWRSAKSFARLTVDGEILVNDAAALDRASTASPIELPPGAFVQAVAAAENRDGVAGWTKHLAGAKHVADLFSGSGTFALRLGGGGAGSMPSNRRPRRSPR